MTSCQSAILCFSWCSCAFPGYLITSSPNKFLPQTDLWISKILPKPNSSAAGLCHSRSVGAALEMFGSLTWLLLPYESFLLCFHTQFWNVSQMLHEAPHSEPNEFFLMLPPSQLFSCSVKNFIALCIVPFEEHGCLFCMWLGWSCFLFKGTDQQADLHSLIGWLSLAKIQNSALNRTECDIFFSSCFPKLKMCLWRRVPK